MMQAPWNAFAVCSLSCAAGCLMALYGESRTHNPIALAGKLVAATSYIAAALSLGAGYSDYGRLMLGAMLGCWLGDMLLVSRRSRKLFLAGLVAFLVGHLVYSIAFLVRDVSWPATWAASVPMAVFCIVVMKWLMPHLNGLMRFHVLMYMLAISVMMALAVGTFGLRGGWAIPLGAALFVASDLFVARNRFVSPGISNRVIGLPLYFSAQLLLAASVVQ